MRSCDLRCEDQHVLDLLKTGQVAIIGVVLMIAAGAHLPKAACIYQGVFSHRFADV